MSDYFIKSAQQQVNLVVNSVARKIGPLAIYAANINWHGRSRECIDEQDHCLSQARELKATLDRLMWEIRTTIPDEADEYSAITQHLSNLIGACVKPQIVGETKED